MSMQGLGLGDNIIFCTQSRVFSTHYQVLYHLRKSLFTMYPYR